MTAGSRTGFQPTPALLRALLEDARRFQGGADAAPFARPLDFLGLVLGRLVEPAERAAPDGRPGSGIRRCAELLGGIESPGGGCFSARTSERCIQLTTRHCPFTDGGADSPLCELAIGALGTLAARHLGYGKVELRRRMTTDDCCEVWIHTDPRQAAAHPGQAYRRVADRICVEPSGTFGPEAGVPTRDSPDTGGNAVPLIVARSESMRAVLRAIDTVARAHTSVLICGETGVGKELVARRLHGLSPRAARPFVAVNCGAIADNLVESALFGHEKGAFTGAHDRQPGVFERAEGGTLFLDEIDSLPLAAQTRLLRVLQEGEFERVGGRRPVRCNVRVVAACNSDLEEQVAQGRFRRDLYFRIHVVGIVIPPLRERREDIPALVEHVLERMRRKHCNRVHEVSLGVLAELIAYDWPGNVRELENVLERSCLFCTDTRITRVDLGKAARLQAAVLAKPGASSLKDQRRRAMDELEQTRLRDELRQAGGSVTAVARRMGITPRAVYLKLQRYGIDPRPYR